MAMAPSDLPLGNILTVANDSPSPWVLLFTQPVTTVFWAIAKVAMNIMRMLHNNLRLILCFILYVGFCGSTFVVC